MAHLSSSEREWAARSIEQVWCAAWGSLGYDGVTRVDDTPGYLRVMTPSSHDLLLNAVLRFQQSRPVTLDDLETVITPYRQAQRPLQWWMRLGSEPVGLRQRLRELGMIAWGTPTGMARSLDRWVSPPTMRQIVTHPAVTPAEQNTALKIICSVFGMDPEPMRHWCGDNPDARPYLATIDDEPVGALVSQITDGVVGFFHVATPPRFRRRGVAHALMCRAMLDAQAQGARSAALTASEMGESLYRRLGFSACCTFELWMPGPRLMTALQGHQ